MKKPRKSRRRTKGAAAKDLPVAKGKGVKGGTLAVAPNPNTIRQRNHLAWATSTEPGG